MNGSTARRERVPKDFFHNNSIKLPPLSEQEAIVDLLDSLDSKIELNKEINEDILELSKNLFKTWFEDFEFSRNDLEYSEELEKEIPESWEIKSLNEIADFLNGKAWQEFEGSKGTELPVVKIRELRKGVMDSSDTVDREKVPDDYILENGDVVFSWSASLVLSVWTDGESFLNQHLFKVTSDHFPKWFYYLWVDYHIRKFRHIADSEKTTMGHIQRGDLDEAKVLVPNEETLKEMSELMQPLFEKLIKNRVENNRLEELRDTLLPKLMSGEIRVNVDGDE